MAKPSRSGTVISDFDLIQKAIRADPRDDKITDLFWSLGEQCLSYLEKIGRRGLTTSIPGKTYFSFITSERSSRAVNKDLFRSKKQIRKFLKAVKDQNITSLKSEEITSACYTLTVSLACVVDHYRQAFRGFLF